MRFAFALSIILLFTPADASLGQTASTPVVIVNGQTLTMAEIDPALSQELNRLEEQIAEARRSVLEQEINTILLQTEAKKRRLDPYRFYELEVRNRIPAPAAAQIKKFLEDNRAQFENVAPAVANRQAVYFLREDAENKLAEDLVKRLRQTNPVTMGVDINSPQLNSESVLATIAGQPLKAGPVIERLKPVVYQLRLGAYELTKRQAEEMVNNLLLLEEARRRQIGPEEIIRAEISDRLRMPSEAEVSRFYAENRERINGDLNSVRNELATYLQSQEKQRLEKELSDRLRKNADIRWLITEPAQPVQNISVDDDPALGDINAPVTIVKFTDFQCPACAAMHPVLEEAFKTYGNKVRLVVRDFPLDTHEKARKAAEAANAARAQGKFFEYIALLYKRQKALDVPSLKRYASELKLNRLKFDAALDRGVYAAEVQNDIQDGKTYGVNSTPAIFVNGVQLRVLSPEALHAAIDRALKPAP